MGAGEKTELAEERTDYAEDRTVLANERTFAGWLRTGLAAVGIGIGFNALFDQLQPTWVPKAIATAFLLIATLIFILASRRATAVYERLNTHEVESVGSYNVRLMAWLFTLATLVLIAALWFLRLK